jgi:hypothetical protein
MHTEFYILCLYFVYVLLYFVELLNVLPIQLETAFEVKIDKFLIPFKFNCCQALLFPW